MPALMPVLMPVPAPVSVPVLMPVAIAFGVDPLHFGLIIILNLSIGIEYDDDNSLMRMR